MPSVHKVKNSPYWFCSFTNADGRRSFKSTKQTDKAEAMRVCLQYADAAKDGREGRLTEGHVRKVMGDIFARANRETLPTGTAREYLQSWLATKAVEVAESSHVQYGIAVSAFLNHLGAKADRPIDTVTLRDITEFRGVLVRRMSPATANKTLKIIGVAWRQARRDGLLTENLFERVQGVKGKANKRRNFTAEEIKSILTVCDTEWRGMVLFGYYTGARLNDIASLTWASVELENAEVHFTAQKTGKPMRLPLHPVLVSYLMSIPTSDNPNAPLFPNAHETTSSGTLSNRFYSIMADAGLVPKRTHGKAKDGRTAKRAMNELSFHSLRHSTASDLRNHGATDVVGMAILGHESAAIAKHYTKIDKGALRQAVESLPDITQ